MLALQKQTLSLEKRQQSADGEDAVEGEDGDWLPQSGAAQPAQSAADGNGKKPIVARQCDSRRRTHGVTNCSMTEAARRTARKEYESEAEKQIQEYLNAESEERE